jgi:hypothetical protein
VILVIDQHRLVIGDKVCPHTGKENQAKHDERKKSQPITPKAVNAGLPNRMFYQH